MDKDKLTKVQRWEIADRLAADRLDIINERLEEVHIKDTVYTRYIKRIIDIIVSAIVLLITLPVNILIGIVTFFDVGFPVFFKQKRTGKDGRLFSIIKFRNMKNIKDFKGELLPPDQRVTKFGKFMRKTSLDELLNFWCILKGDMSLIGPRPLVPEYTNRYSKRHKMRLSVRPGLECPLKNPQHHVWTWQEQFENDVWYVEHVSFWTDCFLCFRLIQFALDQESAKARAGVQRGIFMGYDLDGNAITLDEVPQEYIDIYDATSTNKKEIV